MKNLPNKFIDLLRNVKNKRPRVVIEHIIKHGQITTEELKDIYGYNHPPRAARDVRELGIPLDTVRVIGTGGRKIAAYKFGNMAKTRAGKLFGRKVLAKQLKKSLLDLYGARCHIYLEEFPAKELQVDHRIPFEIAGDALSAEPKSFMLLCAPANRAKSWNCEHCPNWQIKQVKNCQKCYWAFPEKYNHVAMRDIRRLDIVWQEKETVEYDHLKRAAKGQVNMPEYVKKILRRHLRKSLNPHKTK